MLRCEVDQALLSPTRAVAGSVAPLAPTAGRRNYVMDLYVSKFSGTMT